jgi:antitoxin MazE
MIAKIQKWGNSLALRIPMSFAKTIKIEQGNYVKIKMKKNKIIISKKKNQAVKEKEILLEINNEYVKNEIDNSKEMKPE